MTDQLIPGHRYRTPWEPSGIVEVDEDEGESVLVWHVGDHPKGYKAGTIGRYLVKELIGRETT